MLCGFSETPSERIRAFRGRPPEVDRAFVGRGLDAQPALDAGAHETPIRLRVCLGRQAGAASHRCVGGAPLASLLRERRRKRPRHRRRRRRRGRRRGRRHDGKLKCPSHGPDRASVDVWASSRSCWAKRSGQAVWRQFRSGEQKEGPALVTFSELEFVSTCEFGGRRGGPPFPWGGAASLRLRMGRGRCRGRRR